MKSFLAIAALAATMLSTGSAFAAADQPPGAAFQDRGILEWNGIAPSTRQAHGQMHMQMRRAVTVNPYGAYALGAGSATPDSPPGAAFQDRGIREWNGFAPR